MHVQPVQGRAPEDCTWARPAGHIATLKYLFLLLTAGLSCLSSWLHAFIPLICLGCQVWTCVDIVNEIIIATVGRNVRQRALRQMFDSDVQSPIAACCGFALLQMMRRHLIINHDTMTKIKFKARSSTPNSIRLCSLYFNQYVL